MLDKRTFAERFEAVVVPDPIHTGELDADPEVARVSEKFFDDVICSLQLGNRALSLYFRMDWRMIVPRNPQNQLQVTDDSLGAFSLEGEQTLAIMHKERNQGNYLIASFAKFTPTQRTIEVVESLQQAEALIDGKG